MSEIQKKERNLPPTLQRLSQSALCRTLEAGNFKATSDILPKTVKAATKEPPIADVAKVVGKGQVVRFIEFELIKMSSLVSVGNNLNTAQVEFIAMHLVEMFSNESLADFKLCFERGCIGQYGEIFRMDGIVLRKWMEHYLDEKYQVIELELKNEKDNEYKKYIPEEGKDWHAVWLESIKDKKTFKEPPMSDADYRKYGQETPAKKSAATAGYAWFEVRGIKLMATSQVHAEELVKAMIERGELEEG